ncbi:MAG: hypothetical protein HY825_19080 [Acidobacteria bacterium]|nr:hypothetical protein [Acidobacteriota bacterium]
MSRRWVEDARPWFYQAASDARAAEALVQRPAPLRREDVGCHAAAMCAQAIEKSLKGYVLLNRAEPAMDHRPDGYLPALLRGDRQLQYRDHRGRLNKLFDAPTRAAVKALLDLTPGGLGPRRDLVNTEYPWKVANRWRLPAEEQFAPHAKLMAWLDAAKRVSGTLRSLWIAVDRATAI